MSAYSLKVPDRSLQKLKLVQMLWYLPKRLVVNGVFSYKFKWFSLTVCSNIDLFWLRRRRDEKCSILFIAMKLTISKLIIFRTKIQNEQYRVSSIDAVYLFNSVESEVNQM